MATQKTIHHEILIEGIAVHSGKMTKLKLRPAPVNSGILFIRTDLEGTPQIQAHFRNVVDTRMATTIGSGKHFVATVEHLMAALAGCGVDNLIVEISGPEVPVLDGSSAGFCEQIEKVGLKVQDAPRRMIRILKRVEVRQGPKVAMVEPGKGFTIEASIEWDHPVIGEQAFTYQGGSGSFQQVADARTFGFLKDVELLRKNGLALGGSLENAVVLDDDGVLNPEGTRGEDEFVKHKVLDAIGDFFLAGHLEGKFTLHRAGHEMHHQLLVEIFRSSSNYEILEVGQEKSKSKHPDLQPQAFVARTRLAY